MNKVDKTFFEIVENIFKEHDIVFQYKNDLEYISKLHDEIIEHVFSNKSNKYFLEQTPEEQQNNIQNIPKYTIEDFRKTVNYLLLIILFNNLADDICRYYKQNKKIDDITIDKCINFNRIISELKPINKETVINKFLINNLSEFKTFIPQIEELKNLLSILFDPNTEMKNLEGSDQVSINILAIRQQVALLFSEFNKTKDTAIKNKLNLYAATFVDVVNEFVNTYNDVNLAAAKTLSTITSSYVFANWIKSKIRQILINYQLNTPKDESNILKGFKIIAEKVNVYNIDFSRYAIFQSNKLKYEKSTLAEVWDKIPNSIKQQILNNILHILKSNGSRLDKIIDDIFIEIRGISVFKIDTTLKNSFKSFNQNQDKNNNQLSQNEDTQIIPHNDLQLLKQKYFNYIIKTIFNNNKIIYNEQQPVSQQLTQEQPTQQNQSQLINQKQLNIKQQQKDQKLVQNKTASIMHGIINPQDELNANNAVRIITALFILYGLGIYLNTIQEYATFYSEEVLYQEGLISSLGNYIKNVASLLINLKASTLPFGFSTLQKSGIEQIIDYAISETNNPLLQALQKIGFSQFDYLYERNFEPDILNRIDIKSAINEANKEFTKQLQELTKDDIKKIILQLYKPGTKYGKQKQKIEALQKKIQDIKQFGKSIEEE